MKECKYCGTKYKDELDVCPNCGGNLIVTAEEIAQAAELAQKEKENQQRSVVEPQNHLKKLIGIIAGVIAAIIVIVVVASYAHNHRAVNGDLSRADMAEAYEQGMTYYNSKDYASAIAELGKVSAESKYYDEASAILQEAVAIYSDDALSKASAYANVGDYKMACSILENALQVVPANSTLTAELTSYQETIRDQLRSSTLEAVEGSIAENDYPAAIQTLSDALDELSSDIELNALFEKYKSEYRDMIIAQADKTLENDGYEAAISVVNQGLLILNGDTILLQAIENYETYKPVFISELKVLSADSTYINEDPLLWTDSISPYEDVFGNVYQESLTASISYTTSFGSLKEDEFIELYVGGEYSTFSGVLAPYYFKHAPNNVVRVNIYGDENLLGTYDITSNTLPIEYKIDIENVEIIRIAFAPKSTPNWEYCYLIFGNPAVSR